MSERIANKVGVSAGLTMFHVGALRWHRRQAHCVQRGTSIALASVRIVREKRLVENVATVVTMVLVDRGQMHAL
jgi:hypothetical protein